jgi:hypothetical protein
LQDEFRATGNYRAVYPDIEAIATGFGENRLMQ